MWFNRLYYINYISILFRRHDKNATPPKPSKLKDRITMEEETLAELQFLKKKFSENNEDGLIIRKIEDSCNFEMKRIEFLKNKKIDIFKILYLGRNSDYYISKLSFIKDIVCVIKG